MVPLLLAQLVAPPLQNSPVRLPGSGEVEQRPAPEQPPRPIELEPTPASPAPPDSPPPAGGPTNVPAGRQPPVSGLTTYSAAALAKILAPCSAIADRQERLNACAAALTARLVADGYVNSRVYTRPDPAPGSLEVVEGRIVEIQVSSSDPWLVRRVKRLLAPLRGQVLLVPRVERELQLLRRQSGIAEVRGNLTRLGSDPSQAVFVVRLKPGTQPWQGDLSVRNDGSNGSGEFRGVATLLKPSLISRGDTLLLYGEANANDSPDLGSVISSISYTLPLTDNLSLTGAFGYSRRNLIELPEPANGISTNQYQGFGQLEWVFRETLSQRWTLFAAYSGNRSNTYVDGQALPALLPESVRSPSSGYLRFGVSGSGFKDRLGLSGNAYLLQGVGAATSATQRQELATVGIDPGQATALGGIVSAGWAFAPSWQLNLRAAGQVAFEPLSSAMQFSLGSDTGLRGLPGQLISGDNGWLGTAETVWTFWQKKNQALQVVPFIGIGGVSTALQGASFNDTVGAGGLLVRWLAGEHWATELGWVEQFQTNDNLGTWTDWNLAKGVYAKLQYRF
jgi:hemolysin activation/secretion protein